MAIELFSQKTERALLGLVITKPDLMSEISGAIEPSDFFFKDNGLVFEAIQKSFELHGTADEVLIAEELPKISEKPKAEWLTIISSLIFDKGIETNIEKYIAIIKDKKQTRDLETTLKDSVKLVSEGGESVSDLIGKVENKIQDVTKARELKDFDDISQLTGEYQSKLIKMQEEGYQSGLRTKISSLDEKIGGLKGGEFIIVAARPSMGKTAFSLEIAKNVSKTKNVGFFSLEMPSEQLISRMISSESMVNSRKFGKAGAMNQMEEKRVESSIELIKSMNLWIDDSASTKIGELTWKARKLHSKHGLDLIVIDYLQLIDSETKVGENRQQAISDISRQLKALARELEIPVIALSQLSRKVESREDKRPQMSDIRESGAIEQDADIIMFLYREDYYKHKEDAGVQKPMSDLEVIISKHRNGPTGVVKLGLDLTFGKVSSIHTAYSKK